MIASKVSLGSQAVGVVGPVGWTGLLEGPEKKRAFHKYKSSVTLSVLQTPLRTVTGFHWKRNAARLSHLLSGIRH